MAKAEALLKASFAIPSSLVVQEFNKREWPVFLLARGRPQEALDGGERAGGAPVAGGQRDRPRRGGAARGSRWANSRRRPTKPTWRCG